MADECQNDDEGSGRLGRASHDHVFALSVMRCYLASHSQPDTAAWEAGMDLAVAAYGEDRGPRIAWACMHAIRCLRMCRGNPFSFRNPFCKCCQNKLTKHEAYLLDGIEAASCHDNGKLHVASLLLCEGNVDEAFVESLRHLDRTFETSLEHA